MRQQTGRAHLRASEKGSATVRCLPRGVAGVCEGQHRCRALRQYSGSALLIDGAQAARNDDTLPRVCIIAPFHVEPDTTIDARASPHAHGDRGAES